MRIHQLSSAIANQIAAGEVIERPASVVKELLENALDAGATSISVDIGYGGLNQIKVSDNGSGILAEDLPLAIAAHATSKISKLDDLYAIDSMGFRGEALASITSVAKVSISSKPAEQEHAMMLSIRGEQQELLPCARTIGTTIDVVDLFYNAPVRKRFLKNEKIEFQAIETVVKRFALSAPTIALHLKHNNKPVLALPAALNEQTKLARLNKIFGSAFMKDALYLDVTIGGMRLYGWLSGPDFQRSQNDRQWVYINQRMVKDKLINHALKQAYDGLMYPGRFPACLLYFTIENGEVDVNVHPTKHEVRFQQPRLVHDFFTSQLAKVLHATKVQEYIQVPEEAALYVSEPQLMQSNWQESQAIQPTYFDSPLTVRHSKSTDYVRDTSHSQSTFEMPWVVLNKQFALIFIHQQPHVVDVHALQQEALHHQIQQENLPLQGRPLLVPVSYPIAASLKGKMAELKECIGHFGIALEYTKDDTLLIRSVPIKVPHLDLRLFIAALAQSVSFATDQVITLLVKSQAFDPAYLSQDERMELNQLLLNSQPQAVAKTLTIEDCRKLLDV